MTNIKKTTKRGKNLIESAKKVDGYRLEDCYNSYSYTKARAFKECLGMCMSEHGKNFHITSHNTFGFSVAWETETGYRIETPKNSYTIA